MTQVVHVEQARGGGLGASETAMAIGIAPRTWGAPIDLWLEKTGRRPRRPIVGQAADWGQILEPVIRGVYVESHGCNVHIPSSSYYHRAKPWLRATPDGVVLDGNGSAASHLVQVKNVGLRMADHWGTDTKREVPTYYHAQAAVEMAVTGLDRVDFAVLLGGNEYFEITVHRDADLEADILDAAAAFWRCVETDTAPAIDDSEGYGRYLGTLLAAKSKTVVEASPDLDVAIGRWREIRTAAAQLEAEENLIRNRIAAAAVEGGARRIASSYGAIPIVQSMHTSRGWEALARAYGKELGTDVDAAIEGYTTHTPGRATPRAPAAWGKEH
jgi:putative phage-type endonuclease